MGRAAHATPCLVRAVLAPKLQPLPAGAFFGVHVRCASLFLCTGGWRWIELHELCLVQLFHSHLSSYSGVSMEYWLHVVPLLSSCETLVRAIIRFHCVMPNSPPLRWSPWSARDTPSLVSYEHSLSQRDVKPPAKIATAPRFTCGMIMDALMMHQKRQQPPGLAEHQIVRSISPSRATMVHRVRQQTLTNEPSTQLLPERTLVADDIHGRHGPSAHVVSTIHRGADAPQLVVRHVTSHHGALGSAVSASTLSASAESRHGRDGRVLREMERTHMLRAVDDGWLTDVRGPMPVTAPAVRTAVAGITGVPTPSSMTLARPPPIVVRRAEDWNHLHPTQSGAPRVASNGEHLGVIRRAEDWEHVAAFHPPRATGEPSPWRIGSLVEPASTAAPWPAAAPPAPHLSHYYDASGVPSAIRSCFAAAASCSSFPRHLTRSFTHSLHRCSIRHPRRRDVPLPARSVCRPPRLTDGQGARKWWDEERGRPHDDRSRRCREPQTGRQVGWASLRAGRTQTQTQEARTRQRPERKPDPNPKPQTPDGRGCGK